MLVETYPVKPAKIGNSHGFRMDASLFKEHPELLTGQYEAAYLGPGVVLMRLREDSEATASPADDVDPVMEAYLLWTERALASQPELLVPMSAQEFIRAEELVAGVTVDIENDRLPDDFELP
ncbi:MAG: hypothetical protein ACMG51_02420 [Ginsengibacter sp.]